MKVSLTKSDLEIRLLQPEDLEACVPLVSGAFGIDGEIVRDWCDKRLLRNPWQGAINGLGVGIWEAGELTACRLSVAQPWWVAGERKIIAFAAHTCVEKCFRGRGLGWQLIEKSKELSELTGSTSAGIGTQPQYVKAGYTCLGDDNDFYRIRVSYIGSMRKRVGSLGGQMAGTLMDSFLLSRKKMSREVGALKLQPVPRCDHRFDRLWERSREGYAACLERSAEYLNWRLFDCSTFPHEIVGLYDTGGELRGFAVWHKTTFGEGIRMAVLRDFYAPVDDAAAFSALLYHLLELWRGRDISWASLEVAHPQITTFFQKCGFEHVPSNGGRYHLFAAQGLASEVTANWLRSGLDGDYFDIVQNG